LIRICFGQSFHVHGQLGQLGQVGILRKGRCIRLRDVVLRSRRGANLHCRHAIIRRRHGVNADSVAHSELRTEAVGHRQSALLRPVRAVSARPGLESRQENGGPGWAVGRHFGLENPVLRL
jgi:hypothetical protein